MFLTVLGYTLVAIISEMCGISHNQTLNAISGMREVVHSSGNMRLAISLGKPVITTNTFQLRDSLAYRIKSLVQINLDYLKKMKGPINLDDVFPLLKRILESM